MGGDLVAVTTATAFVMLVMLVAATAIVVFATTSTAVAVTSATTRHVLNEVVNLFLSGVAVFYHGTLEIKRLASQRVVQVYLDFLFANLYDASVEAVALFVLKGYDSVLIDVFMVEVAIDAERFAV